MAKRKVESGPWSRIGEASSLLSGVQDGVIWHRPVEGAPLSRALQEVSNDILGWFDPEQGWRLQALEVNSNMENGHEVEPAPPTRVFGEITKIEPRLFAAKFKYQAEDPPMVGDLAFLKFLLPNQMDLAQVLEGGQTRFQYDASSLPKNAFAMVEKVGTLYKEFDQAVKANEAPYFLSTSPWIQIVEPETQTSGKKSEPGRDLLVTILAESILDRLQSQINQLRRQQYRVTKKHGK